MEVILDGLAASPIAEWVRQSRWGYAGIATAHVLGISLLVGAILPMDLRLLGAGRAIDIPGLARLLLPVAVTGLLLAIGSGLLMFSGRATEYAGYGLFQIKIALVLTGAASALLIHCRFGPWLQGMPRKIQIRTAILSLCSWLGALICGRSIAFLYG